MNGTVTINIDDFLQLKKEAGETKHLKNVIKRTIDVYDEDAGVVDAWDFREIEKLALDLFYSI